MSALAREALAPTQTEHGSSRIAELQRCAVAHELRYVKGILPRADAVYYDVGRYTHAGLRYVNEGVIVGEPRDWRDVIAEARELRAAEIAAGRAEAPRWDEIDPIDEAERLLALYYAHHGEDNGGWPAAAKLLFVEHHLEDLELRATARADLVIELDGEIILPDTKTRSKVLPKDRDAFLEELRTNEQFLRLSALAQRHWTRESPPPVWLDAIIKSARPPRDGGGWPVDRLLVRFTQEQIDAWRENQLRLVEVADALRKLPVVRNYHECAPPIGSRCWAFKYCHGNDEQKARLYRVRSES